ncbi:hypothetical protein GCM10023210_31380 [Chryseobacterium ginsengisoli]|uniref:Uncharacterized protein n=1 Tax=Chryseobacterium ginsengisoli TaxID=363853 RepID=A0ABP9MNE9_9FLAO
MENIVLHNQTLLDISIQYTGNVENCFQIAIANGKSVSDDLTSGMTFEEPEALKIDDDILSYFKAKRIHPATGNIEFAITELGGIDYMKIGGNFRIK